MADTTPQPNPADNPECSGCDSLQPYVTVHEHTPQPAPQEEEK
jgi:hypothetical protein